MTHNYLLEFYGALVNRLPTRSCSAGRFATYAFLVLVSLHGQAQNYTVNTTADGTSSSGTVNLRGAILAADAAGGNHTITVPAGTYNLTLGQISFGNNAQNIAIQGAGLGNTIINMTTQDRIFKINPPGTIANVQTSISGIKFTNGQVNSDNLGGGAVLCGGPNNSVTFTQCAFDNNTINPAKLGRGGAIRCTGGGTLAIDQCTFTGNVAPTNPNLNGGGGAVLYQLFAYSIGGVPATPNANVSITNSTFSNNAVGNNGSGGALTISSSEGSAGQTFTVNIAKNTFINNQAPGGVGGAICTINSFAVGNTWNINYNRFVGNTAGSGTALETGDVIGSVNATNN